MFQKNFMSKSQMSGSWISGNLVMPGVRLGVTMFVRLQGHNTYTQHGYIYSSLVGELKLVTNADRRDEWLHGRQPRPRPIGVQHSQIVSVNPR